jgi:cytokinin dehydrogenase
MGGTLADGGVGGTTSTFGMMSDTVTELEVVTGRGDKLTCSPSRNAELFVRGCDPLCRAVGRLDAGP